MGYQYAPSPFMLDTSHYDKAKADRAVAFIENLCHTKGKWAGKKFLLLPITVTHGWRCVATAWHHNRSVPMILPMGYSC